MVSRGGYNSLKVDHNSTKHTGLSIDTGRVILNVLYRFKTVDYI
jgi:hypothetical protein